MSVQERKSAGQQAIEYENRTVRKSNTLAFLHCADDGWD
jgi:hypothetical protein